jgi:tetratricopeptide (TPR) repeat protein
MNPKIFISVALLAIAAIPSARADSTREYAPTPAPAPAAPARATLDDAARMVNAGDYRGAIPVLTAIVQKDANNTDALNLMGYSLRKTGQPDMALQYYNRALALQPKHIGANEYLGELYAELGQIDKAKERLGILQAVCGNCSQTQELSQAIEKAQKKS